MTINLTSAGLLLAGGVLFLFPLCKTLLRQFRVWKCWFKLPHTPAAFSSLAGDVFEHHSATCHKSYMAWSRLGSVVGLRLGPLPVVMVTSAELARPVLEEPKAEAYKDMQAIYSQHRASLLTNLHDSPSSAQYYKSIRRQIAPAFNTSNLKQSFGRLASLMHSAVNYIHQKGPAQSVDIYTIAGRVTLNAISLSIFGEDLKGNEGSWEIRPEYACTFEPAVKWVLDTAALAWVRNMIFIPAVWQKGRELKQLQQEHVKMLKQLRACKPLPASLGGHLLALTDPATGQPLNDGQLEAEMATFFFAGYDTSTSAITWTLALIAAHPEVQQQVATELAALGLLATPEQPSPKALTWQALSDLEYLRKVIKESQRLQTVITTGTVRVLSKPMRLGKYDLAEGTLVHVPFYPIHHDPAAWDRPEDFLPERFNEAGADFLPADELAGHIEAGTSRLHQQPEGQSKSGRVTEDGDLHGGSFFQETGNTGHQKETAGSASQIRRFLPFSYGHRSCVGQNLANMTMLTFIAAICANFSLALDPKMGGLDGLKECGAVALTLQPKSAVLLQCTPRRLAAAL